MDNPELEVSNNGHMNGFVALPKELAQYPEMLAVIMQETRLAAQGRTVALEKQAQAADRRVYFSSGVLVVALLVIAWLVWMQREVQPLIQVVERTEEGQLVQMGQPIKVLEFTPEDGQWTEMLGEWLRREFWRGKDMNKEERLDRRWVDLHTCPSARGKLALGPFGRKARQEDKKDRKRYDETTVAIDIDTITKTPTPESFQALWSRFVINPDHPMGVMFWYTTTFTVDRVQFTRRADVQENFFGLCVSSFSTEDSKRNPEKR